MENQKRSCNIVLWILWVFLYIDNEYVTFTLRLSHIHLEIGGVTRLTYKVIVHVYKNTLMYQTTHIHTDTNTTTRVLDFLIALKWENGLFEFKWYKNVCRESGFFFWYNINNQMLGLHIGTGKYIWDIFILFRI